jgi:DNA-binding PadR family transcriptional regulator
MSPPRDKSQDADPGPCSIEQIQHVAEQAGISDDPAVQRLIQTAAATRSNRVRQRILHALHMKRGARAVYPFEDHAGATAGQTIRLGTTLETGQPFFLGVDALTRHVLLAGETGAGKTNTFYVIAAGAARHDIPFWAVDVKQDYRHLRETGVEPLVIPWEVLRVNPLRPPPGVPVSRWRMQLKAIFGEAYDLASGSQGYFSTHLSAVYEAYALTDHTPTADREAAYPCFADLLAYIEADGETGQVLSRYRERVTFRLRELLTDLGETVTVSHGFSLAELVERNVVFELDGLSTQHQDFLMEYLLVWLYHWRQARTDRSNGLRHLVLFDEGKRAFARPKEDQSVHGIPTIDEVVNKLREFGEGLIVGDQQPVAKLTQAIKANTGTTVLFRLGTDDEFRTMADSIGLDERQQDYAVDALATGQAVVRSGHCRPAPVHIRFLDVAKAVTDQQVVAQCRGEWQALYDAVADRVAVADVDEAVGASDASAAAPLAAGETGESPAAETETGVSDGETGETPMLSADARAMLKDVVRRPFVSATDRYDLFSSQGKGYNVKQELVDAGIVTEKWVEDGPRKQLLDLTGTGREYLAETGVEWDWQWRGGIVHGYWQHRIREACREAGMAAELEVNHADVAVETAEKRVAIEVAMQAAEREAAHVRERFGAGFDAVVVACRTDAVRETLQADLAADDALADQVGETVRLHVFQDVTDPKTVVP